MRKYFCLQGYIEDLCCTEYSYRDQERPKEGQIALEMDYTSMLVYMNQAHCFLNSILSDDVPTQV